MELERCLAPQNHFEKFSDRRRNSQKARQTDTHAGRLKGGRTNTRTKYRHTVGRMDG